MNTSNRHGNLLSVLIVTLLAAIVIASCSPAPGQPRSTLDVVRERGRVIVGVRYDTPPFGYLDETGEVSGIDIDIAKYVAQYLEVDIEFKQVTAATRIPELENGNVDFLASATAITRERIEAIDFTVPYMCDYSVFLVKKDSGILGIEDLPGKTVAVIQGTPYLERVENAIPQANTLVLQEYPQALTALQQGQADAIFTGETILIGLMQVDPNTEIVGEPTMFPFYCAGLAMRHDDSKWRNTLSIALIEMWYSGLLPEKWEEHFGVPPNPAFLMPTWEL